jgi:hypothetical protein
MELDELKTMWVALDERLKKQEVLKEGMIGEMIRSKADKTVNKLVTLEIIGAIIVLLLIPFIVFALDRFGGKTRMWDVYVFSALILCGIIFIWQLYKICGLMKIDLSKSVSHNTCYVSRFNIQIKREKFVLSYILGPALAIGAIAVYAVMHAGVILWVFLGCMTILSGLTIWVSYRRIYARQIASIQKSLNELKALEEE